MNRFRRWLADVLSAWADPFQEPEEWSHSFPPTGETPEGLDCPDTQPTSPGALDSDLGQLEGAP